MRGVILAAGIGKRLRPITNDIPKAMVVVGGKTIIEHMLDSFVGAGIRDAVIVVGFNQEAVREKIGTNYKGMPIIYIVNEKYDSTNNLYSLWKARDTLSGEFIQVHGDVIVHPEIIKRVLNSEIKSAVVVDRDPRNFVSDANRVKIHDGRVMEINKLMPFNESGGRAFGLYKFSKQAAKSYVKFLEENKDDAKNGFEICLRPTMQEVHFGVIDITGLPYAEVDDLNDLKDAEKRIYDLVGN